MSKHIHIHLNDEDTQGRQSQRPQVEATSANILNYIKMLNETTNNNPLSIITKIKEHFGISYGDAERYYTRFKNKL